MERIQRDELHLSANVMKLSHVFLHQMSNKTLYLGTSTFLLKGVVENRPCLETWPFSTESAVDLFEATDTRTVEYTWVITGLKLQCVTHL
jgi:hypothetical protein